MAAVRRQRRHALALLICCSAVQWYACAGPTDPAFTKLDRDRVNFEANVLPVLIRDCSFPACHGSPVRFFQVYGLGHGRLLPGARALDPLSPEELELAYQRSLSMIDPHAPASSPLLRKPLAPNAGGAGHKGVDRLGRDVYQSAADAGFKVLEQWVMQAPVTAPAGGT